MTKQRERFFSILLSIALIFSTVCVYAAATEAPDSSATQNSIDSPYTIDTPYEYPIQPGTPEWDAYETTHEKAVLCQIPEDILGKLTTPALVETIVNYPFLVEMTLFATPEEGYAAVHACFNGLPELERRPDGGAVLMDYYEICKKQRSDLIFLDFMTMEIILQQPEITVHMSPAQQQRASTMTQEMSTFFRLQPTPAANVAYPKTPSGYEVTKSWCTYDKPELTEAEINDINALVLEKYSLSPLRQPTNKYNCHSYAWYNTSSANKWWIDYPNDFINDPYCTRNISAPVAGNRAVYRILANGNFVHSAIVQSVSNAGGTSSPNAITVVSKWGKWGLYSHTLFNVPESYGRNVIFYQIK
ncbi:hypothetical protein [Pseudoflavonifractor sp. 524-17]|uniref:hypothetical protein n=1 Tax=Pseudoflavonifractor sp. 524-17 TaxID=2304577 RepID=UPI00137B3196|nr:hypothetical protein [Pseudoflavonifractor sp. 524-17]